LHDTNIIAGTVYQIQERQTKVKLVHMLDIHLSSWTTAVLIMSLQLMVDFISTVYKAASAQKVTQKTQ